MSVLVVGVSHRSAPVSLLERLALSADESDKLAIAVTDHDHISEAAVLATCNRIEVYADVERFHSGTEAVGRLLSDRLGGDLGELLPHLYVHYDDGAVAHLFNVAAGLDSMAIGEGQILGQARDALTRGQEVGTIGPALNSLFQQALRVGKRAHAETEIDHSAPSMVTAALAQASTVLGDLAGRRAVVVGAGSLAALAVATTSRAGADVVIVNRSFDRALQLAHNHDATAHPFEQLAEALVDAHIVISCTGAAGVIIGREDIAAVGHDVVLVDLALPHDIDPSVAELERAHLISLATLSQTPDEGAEPALADVRAIVAEELAAFVAARRSASVTPTLVALRGMATSVVDAEIERLRTRVPSLSDAELSEVAQTVRRVADKLIHQPTVRVKELAAEPKTVSYATALAELFALDPDAVDAVTTPVTLTQGAR